MATRDEALLEAYATCPPSARVFYTLELWQSSFAQAARVVANVGDDMVFGIEQGAPRDAGATVSFLACPIQAAYPEQREGQPPSTKITIDNVSRELVPLIRAALGVRQYIDVLYREYLSSDLTEPAYGPVEFELREVQMRGTSLKNLQNKRFPRLTKNYDYIQFPSLFRRDEEAHDVEAPAAAAWWHCWGSTAAGSLPLVRGKH